MATHVAAAAEGADMRIWRDIISRHAWNNSVMMGKGNTGTTMSSATPVGKVAQLRGVFDRSLSSRDAALQKMTQKIDAYHGIEKAEYRNIDRRIAALKDISSFARDVMKTFGISESGASVRHGPSATRDAQLKAYTSSNPRDATLDRHLLTLARRSLRKAGYLKMLKQYYAPGGAGYAHRSPQVLRALFQAPKEVTNTAVGLEPELRLEQLDPVHRSNYEDMNDGGCGKAFHLWVSDTRQDKPFFLWLENSLVCLEDDKIQAAAQSIPYDRMDQRNSSGGHRQRIVCMPAPLTSFDLDKIGSAHSICSTATFSCDAPKDPSHAGGGGVAAYVWTEEGELFIGEHRGNVFHHSSFVSGRRVRCAGMIKIQGGYVTAVSNNSGHYKPRKAQLHNFVQWLQGAGAFAPNAVVEAFLGNGQAFNGSPSAFLSS
jgi:hypothetical protein